MASPVSGGDSENFSSEPSIPRESTGSTIADALSVEENGRFFNAYREGKYLLPNDGHEQNRLDLQHHMWLLMLKGKLQLAPIKETARVLDIGTGTGIWAIQLAKKYPRSNVIGTDISLIQPRENLPPNCTFEREDAEETWVFDAPFDFIHWRLMCTCFSDFKAMISKVYSHLAPGGWAEFQDWGANYFGEDEAAEEFLQASALGRWIRYGIAGGAKLGRDFNAALNFKRHMIEAGFTDIVEEKVLVPMNGWPLDPEDQLLGKWHCLNLLHGIGAFHKLLLAGGFPPEEVPALLEQVRVDATNWNMRVYCSFIIIYGRKPEDSGRQQVLDTATKLEPGC